MKTKHIYKSILSVKSRRELAEILYNNIVFNAEGIVALNKPYGLRNGTGIEDPHDIKFRNVSPFNFCISEALPILAQMLNLPKLEVARSPEKFASGVTILFSDRETGIKISRSLSCATEQHRFSYQAVCCGIPLKVSDETKLGLMFDTNEKDKFHVTLLDKFSRKSILKAKIKKIFYKHEVTACDIDQKVSVIEVTTNRILWYYVPLYLTTRLLTPIIGDHLHGSKVKYVFNKPILLPKLNPVAYSPQKLPKDLCRKLSVNEEKYDLIPNHLHLAKITLSHWFKNHEHLVVSAPPPAHFQWTCSQLKVWNDPESSISMEVIV